MAPFAVYVSLKREDRPEDTDIWRVAAILVRENGHFASVDDVIWLKDNPQELEVRLSEYLAQGCDGPHWVGDVDSRYPNEVPGYRFYLNVAVGRLEPLASTMSDVRGTLGNRYEATDVSANTEAYAGDEKALKPVFT